MMMSPRIGLMVLLLVVVLATTLQAAPVKVDSSNVDLRHDIFKRYGGSSSEEIAVSSSEEISSSNEDEEDEDEHPPAPGIPPAHPQHSSLSRDEHEPPTGAISG
eukprot:scpid97623/ scgid13141/ 